jgi:hypothetical protein
LPRSAHGPHYLGCRLVYLPTVRHKYFDTVAHTFLPMISYSGARTWRSIATRRMRFSPGCPGAGCVALNVVDWSAIGRSGTVWGRVWYDGRAVVDVVSHRVVSDAERIKAYYGETYARFGFIP